MHPAADAGVNSSVLGRVAVVDDAGWSPAICVLCEGTGLPRRSAIRSDLFVDPAFRGQGIARTMIKSLQSEGRTKAGRGCTGIRAVISCPSSV